MKKLFFVPLATLMMCLGVAGCGTKETQETAPTMEQYTLNDGSEDTSPKNASLTGLEQMIIGKWSFEREKEFSLTFFMTFHEDYTATMHYPDEVIDLKWKYDETQDAFFVSRRDKDDYRTVYYSIEDDGRMTITYANTKGYKMKE